VDINNISRVSSGSEIHPDDRGYPVCDKSIAALFHLEEQLGHTSPQQDEPPYGRFLNPERIGRVRKAERTFHMSAPLPRV